MHWSVRINKLDSFLLIFLSRLGSRLRKALEKMLFGPYGLPTFTSSLRWKNDPTEFTLTVDYTCRRWTERPLPALTQRPENAAAAENHSGPRAYERTDFILLSIELQ